MHTNAVVIACQQDKKKDKPYLLPLPGRLLYCHSSVTYGGAMYVLAAPKKESSKKGSKIFKAQKLRNARQILHFFSEARNLALLTKTKKE
jgi:hypothetical protein